MGEQPAGPPYAAYFNRDMDDLEVEIGFPVTRKLSGKKKVQACEIPAGHFAVCFNTGPHEQIETAYHALGAFMEERSVQPAWPSYEFDLNDPQESPPQDFQTKVISPITPA